MYVHSNTTTSVGCGVIVNSDSPVGLDGTSDACLDPSSISVTGTGSETDDPGDDFCGYGSEGDIANFLRSRATFLPPDSLTVAVEWEACGNSPGNDVRGCPIVRGK